MGNAIQKLSAVDVVSAFRERLRSKKTEVATVASFWNGFEGWLKFELGLALAGTSGRRPWTGPEDRDVWNTIGVEFKASVSPPSVGRRDSKQLDVWVCSVDDCRWHAIELKVAFARPNAGKQVASWRSDFDALCRIGDPACDARIALLLAVGFTPEDFIHHKLESQESIVEAAGKGEQWTPSVHLVSLIHHS